MAELVCVPCGEPIEGEPKFVVVELIASDGAVEACATCYALAGKAGGRDYRRACPHEVPIRTTTTNGATITDFPVHCCRTNDELEAGRTSHLRSCACFKLVGPGY